MTHEPDGTAAIDRGKGDAAGEARKSWWQWVMLYPQVPVALISVLGGALVASVPQILQWKAASEYNVPVGELARVREQLEAWSENAKCLREIQRVNLRGAVTYTIDLQSCPSGDILLILTPLHDPDRPVNQWIITRKLFKREAGFSFTTTALAQDPRPRPASPSPIRVIDIRTQGSNVLRRLQLSDNTCIDEIIDPATGRRLSSKSAPCARF